MSNNPYLILLEVIGENELLVHYERKSRNYLIQVEQELANFCRDKLVTLEEGEEILLEFDKEGELDDKMPK
ncbi:MAG: hypothetical protein L0L39_06450 [Atopostipes suicloacalis]|nr:hypothetical protein [Atopostipes suicloacalis]MDN6731806.1 hypothetical protein [Atopostipes suicloacalis]